MIELLRNKIENKNLLILGFGREGKSTLKRIKEAGGYSSVTVADKFPVNDLSSDIKLISGDSYQKTMNNYDIVFKSPGVVLEKPFESYKCQVTSQTEIFLEKYSSNVIGITGTK